MNLKIFCLQICAGLHGAIVKTGILVALGMLLMHCKRKIEASY